MNEGIIFLEKMISSKSKEDQIRYLEIKERQQYHYYIDASNNFTSEQNKEYNDTWNWMITKLNELKRSVDNATN